MARIVSVHYVDKDEFMKGNVELDPDEVVMVFERSPNYVEVVEKVRIEFKSMSPTDDIEFEGRYNVSFGMHNRWKTMKLNSDERWSAYKEVVAESQDNALSLFSTNKVSSRTHLDFYRHASQFMVGARLLNPMLTSQQAVLLR
jgi:hypothetical protein